MNTLSIVDVFKNFAFYKQNYQIILSHSHQYKIVVHDASISVWPLPSKQLYLGDLLQLWFSQKWLVNQNFSFPQQHVIADLFKPFCQRNDLYLYQLDGNALLGKGVAKVWSTTEQCTHEIILESSLQYYCTYKSVA